MKRSDFRQKGFTLVEMIFVLAIILTLVAIFLPLAMSKFADSKTARTNADLDAIAAALTNFFGDVDRFPTCDSANCDPLNDTNNNLKFLAFGTGSGSLTGEYPDLSTSGTAWDLSNNDSTVPERNNAYNHLVQNNPNADGTVGDSTTTGFKDYKSSKWKGPYIAKLAKDQFGKDYIAHVGAMETNGVKISASGKGWIISAGPDGFLDTAPSDSTLSNDDLGFIFFTK